MRKRIICVLTIFILVSMMAVPSYAVDFNEKTFPSTETEALLVNQYGEAYKVKATVENSYAQKKDISKDEFIFTKSVTINTRNIEPLSTTDSNYREKWDSSGSVKANSTIYFKSKGTPTQYLLTKVKVGYSISDSSVRVVDQELIAGCIGAMPEITTQRKVFYPTGTSAAYNTGFTKYVVNSQSAMIGSTYTIEMKRGTSSTWSLIFNNRL